MSGPTETAESTLDCYLRQQARRDADHYVAAEFVLVDTATNRIAGALIDLPSRDPNRSGRASVTGATEPTTKPDPPATGSPEDLASLLRGYADVGIGHVQLWLDPSTVAGLEAFAPVLELLDRG